MKDSRRDSLNNKKSIEVSRGSLSYRSLAYTVDDNKQDIALQNSDFQKLTLEKPHLEQRARSSSYAGYTRRTTNMNGSSTNWLLPSTERSGSSRQKPTNFEAGNTSFAGAQNVQWATVQHRARSSINEGPKGVLVSRLV